MSRTLSALVWLVWATLAISTANAESVAPIAWQSDYGAAMDEARFSRKFLLVWFHNPQWSAEDAKFAAAVFEQPDIAERLAKSCIAIKLPVDAKSFASGEEITLLKHGAFRELLDLPGVAMIDLRDKASPHFGRVVSIFPFQERYITREQLRVMLDLPTGTLTQRTLIWAVRTHPERPASASTDLHEVLETETQKHSIHQASITLQGHHNWGSRFHSINSRLPDGLVSQEVCAESWPGQNLVEAAEECVHSWRQSSGHWDAVSRQHVYFSYDMQLGTNGVWYATGIFAQRH
ncbi:MAG: hypothetical protein SFU86_04835 [Pirellulaceae bacterium]|nr:hypothetical protein [Pirellulaceae bacterium]